MTLGELAFDLLEWPPSRASASSGMPIPVSAMAMLHPPAASRVREW